ncbi:MAG: LicD family protein [Blautia sp.]|jgi:lipopolysaccharide cholinephosphotransferase
MLYKEYEPEVLRKLQKAEVEILKDFDALCEKHGIDYFVCGGTAIGGVRHQGFIPWDDDIDIGMTREDYEHFLKVADSEYGDKYGVINPDRDSSFPAILTKWYRKGTLFRNQEMIDLGLSIGIAIDIFCFDNVADDVKSLKKQGMRAWVWSKLLILRQIGSPSLYVEGWKAKLTLLASRLIHGILKALHLSPSFLYQKAIREAEKYRDVHTKRVGYLFDPTPYTSIINKKDIYPTVKRKFEDIELRFPCRVEKYLERRYGKDYMNLPPEDKRHNHAPEELDFGEAFGDL